MPIPLDISSCLAFVPEQARVRIGFIPFVSLRLHLAAQGLKTDDAVRVVHSARGDVLVETDVGARIFVQRRYAVLIETIDARRMGDRLDADAVRQRCTRGARLDGGGRVAGSSTSAAG